MGAIPYKTQKKNKIKPNKISKNTLTDIGRLVGTYK